MNLHQEHTCHIFLMTIWVFRAFSRVAEIQGVILLKEPEFEVLAQAVQIPPQTFPCKSPDEKYCQ